ncbi:peroxiredoxin [Thioalkalivibrio sulfidiphilus]|uniref:peroxiredoxin n=1 Tax=Thioalkalivibrio sulfidiphilus TaxID=1033854 RepID=UPI0022AC44A8|nr:peroxiredoxin [Thioalkalivibrio sulfidiphilus]
MDNQHQKRPLMPQVALNKPVPDFERPATGDKTVRLSDFKGKQHVVIYFYPKDDTPGCTTEGKDFTEQYARLAKQGVAVLGVSRDSLKSHEKFKEKYGFPFDLLSDEDESLCTLFDVIKMKNMYGKQVRGIERSTFLIDKNGVLRREWRKVKVPGHVDEVLEAIKEL